jgi:hypothetical protein
MYPSQLHAPYVAALPKKIYSFKQMKLGDDVIKAYSQDAPQPVHLHHNATAQAATE